MTTHKKTKQNSLGLILVIIVLVFAALAISFNSMNQVTKQNGSLPSDTNTPPAVVSTDAQTAGATPADI